MDFYRLDYPEGFDLALLSARNDLAGLQPALRRRLRRGDVIAAARYDADSQTGRVRMLGHVRSNDATLVVEWRPAEFDLRPSRYGRQQWARPEFRFDDAVAARYNLAGHHTQIFGVAPGAQAAAMSGTAPAAADPGHVYVIKSAYGFKIGKSRRPHDRLRLFGVKLPFPFEVVVTGWSPEHSRLERDLHRQFADKRLEGEWFALDDADLAHICVRLGGD